MIDGGPLRTSRPTGRQAEYQDESVRYQPEEPQRVEMAAPIESSRRSQQYRQEEIRQSEPAASDPKKPRNYSWVKWPIFLVIVAAIAAGAWMFWPSNASIKATIDADKYQAVFLSNGQVYFGRLTIVDNSYMKLTNVYYLERQLTANTEETEQPTVEDETTTPTGDNNFQLLKYSDVLYGSEDAMIISSDDIIRYENLRSDGVVAKAIANRG